MRGGGGLMAGGWGLWVNDCPTAHTRFLPPLVSKCSLRLQPFAPSFIACGPSTSATGLCVLSNSMSCTGLEATSFGCLLSGMVRLILLAATHACTLLVPVLVPLGAAISLPCSLDQQAAALPHWTDSVLYGTDSPQKNSGGKGGGISGCGDPGSGGEGGTSPCPSREPQPTTSYTD